MIDPLTPPTLPQPDPPERKEVYWTKTGAIATIVLGILSILVSLGIAYGPWLVQKLSSTPAGPSAPDQPSPGEEGPTAPAVEVEGVTGTTMPEPAPPVDGERVEPGDLLAGSGAEEPGSPPVPSPPPAGSSGGSGKTRQPQTPPRAKEPERVPAQVTETPVQTIPIVPDPVVPSGKGAGPETAPRDPGFQEGVVARYFNPSGPRILGEITLPRLPTDALRSLAAGKELRVLFWVTAEGQGTVTEIDAPWLPEAVQRRIGEHLQRRRWKPSNDGSGTLRASEAGLIFSWKRAKK